MESNPEYQSKNQKKEIEQIASKLRKKYPNYSNSFSLQIAEELYQNGIYLDKLTEFYYNHPFNLEEIIFYLAKKIERKNKILTYTFNKKEELNQEKFQTAQIFSFQMKAIEPTYTMKYKSYKRTYKEENQCQNYQK